MASKNEKKDAATGTPHRSADDDDTESDSETYYTAEGSAQTFNEPAEKPESEVEPGPLLEPEEEPRTSDKSNKSQASQRSVNPSVFGEDERLRYDSIVRRPTIEWPESGCIYIPLRPESAPSSPYDDEPTSRPESSAEANDAKRRSVKIKKPDENDNERDN